MIQFVNFYCYGLALLSMFICLGRLRIACRYIFNLWHLRQRIDSLAQWLGYWIFIRRDRVRIPQQTGNFFQPCFIPLLWLSCRKMGARSRLDFTLLKMASSHHKWWLPWNFFQLCFIPLLLLPCHNLFRMKRVIMMFVPSKWFRPKWLRCSDSDDIILSRKMLNSSYGWMIWSFTCLLTLVLLNKLRCLAHF